MVFELVTALGAEYYGLARTAQRCVCVQCGAAAYLHTIFTESLDALFCGAFSRPLSRHASPPRRCQRQPPQRTPLRYPVQGRPALSIADRVSRDLREAVEPLQRGVALRLLLGRLQLLQQLLRLAGRADS